MNIEHLEQFLTDLESSPGELALHHDDLSENARWCIDRILALGGTKTSRAQKGRLIAAQERVRALLDRIDRDGGSQR